MSASTPRNLMAALSYALQFYILDDLISVYIYIYIDILFSGKREKTLRGRGSVINYRAAACAVSNPPIDTQFTAKHSNPISPIRLFNHKICIYMIKIFKLNLCVGT